jgi:hypothetical protein
LKRERVRLSSNSVNHSEYRPHTELFETWRVHETVKVQRSAVKIREHAIRIVSICGIRIMHPWSWCSSQELRQHRWLTDGFQADVHEAGVGFSGVTSTARIEGKMEPAVGGGHVSAFAPEQ